VQEQAAIARPIIGAEIGGGGNFSSIHNTRKANRDALEGGKLRGKPGNRLEHGLRRRRLRCWRTKLLGREHAGGIENRRLHVGPANVDAQCEGR
jgi:hypothetical protein